MSEVGMVEPAACDHFRFFMQPLHWARKSDDLWQSAQSLWQSYEYMLRNADSPDRHAAAHGSACIALMLLGLSIENAMKGLLIGHELDSKKANQLKEIEETFQAIINHSHNLHSLWVKISLIFDFQSNEDHKRNFHRLSEYIFWYAKYPLPKKRGQFDDFRGKGRIGKLYDVDQLYDWSFHNHSLLKISLDKLVANLPLAEAKE